MRHPNTLDCLVFGAILGNHKRLEGVEVDDVGDSDLAGIVANLKQGQKDGLAAWLKEHGVKWDQKGPAIEAIQAEAKKQAKLLRAKRAANLAKFMTYQDAEDLADKLRKLADSIGAMPDGKTEA